ncbi:hypothetical protein VTN77DRAFT_621 [Rasamsonia byssochlamydoides]|uniref:uncharacterized protein n=1 Tax=Rasamsonia byssochlamydoides TaxID=89139 RepID=UPI0037441FB5
MQSTGSVEPGIARTETGLTLHTRYMEMLLELDYIPLSHTFLASLFHWMLLAGYLVIPGTFTSLQKSDTIKHSLNAKGAEETVLHTIQNPPLLAIACSLLFIGAAGMSWLGWTWRHNYIWIINRLFRPTLLNAAAGLLTTLINIYTAKDGDWSIMAVLTVAITAASALTCLILMVLFQFRKLAQVKEEHEREMRAARQITASRMHGMA